MKDKTQEIDESFIDIIGDPHLTAGVRGETMGELRQFPMKLKQELLRFGVKICLTPTMNDAFAATGDPILAPQSWLSYQEYSSSSKTLYLADGPEDSHGYGRTTQFDLVTGLLQAFGELSGAAGTRAFREAVADDSDHMSPNLAARYLIAPTARYPLTNFYTLGWAYLTRERYDFCKSHFKEVTIAYPKTVVCVEEVLRPFCD